MKNIKISITIETILKIFFLGVLSWLIYRFSNLLLIIITSIIISTSFEPLVNKLQAHKIPRVFSVSIVYLAITSAIVSMIIFITPTITKQITLLTSNLSEYSQTFDSYILQETLNKESLMGNILLQADISSDNIKNFFNLSGDTIKSLITSVTSGLSTFILIMVLSFYFAIQEHGMQNFLKIIVPAKYRKYSISLWTRAQMKITQWIQGQFIISLIIGVMVYVGLLSLGVNQAGILSLLAGFAELIPVVGQIAAAIPAIFLGFIDQGVSFALIIMAMYIIIQFVEGQIIYPLLVKKLVDVPSVIVILSLIIGAELFGFLGIIISIPLAAVAMEFVRDITKRQEKDLKLGKEKEVNFAK